MKTKIIYALIALSSSLSQAASVTLTSDYNNPDPKLAALAELPADTLSLLIGAGLKLKDIGRGQYLVTTQNVHCDLYNGNAVEGPLAGIVHRSCRRDSENVKESKRGKLFRDGRELESILTKIDQADLGVYFTDCAMGYCGTFAKSISCVVDTKIESYSNGRFSCTYEQ